MLTVPEKSVEVSKVLEEKRVEEERMQDVLLLLQNLFRREETTVKMILDCLYDVGSVNLINNRFPDHRLNGIMKSIAKLSKPGFRIVGLWWFNRNCPQLITNWLRSQVTLLGK